MKWTTTYTYSALGAVIVALTILLAIVGCKNGQMSREAHEVPSTVGPAKAAEVPPSVGVSLEVNNQIPPAPQPKPQEGFVVPPGYGFYDKTTETITEDRGMVKDQQRGTSIGPSGRTTGTEVKLDINGQPVNISLPGGQAVWGGGFDLSGMAKVAGFTWLSIVFFLLAVAAAGMAFMLVKKIPPAPAKDIAACVAAAIGFFMAGLFPGVALFIIGAIGVLAMVLWWMSTYKVGNLSLMQKDITRSFTGLSDGADALISGIALLPEPIKSYVTHSIGAQATDEDRKVIHQWAHDNQVVLHIPDVATGATAPAVPPVPSA